MSFAFDATQFFNQISWYFGYYGLIHSGSCFLCLWMYDSLCQNKTPDVVVPQIVE